jgi:hypothetical protein
MNPAQSQASQFPNIYRFITEYPLPDKYLFYGKVLVSSFFSGVLVIGIALQVMFFVQNRQETSRVVAEREQVVGEAKYWETMADKYKGYRDIYYHMAVLKYRLGDANASKTYVKKALELDPNFEEGRVLGAKIGF